MTRALRIPESMNRGDQHPMPRICTLQTRLEYRNEHCLVLFSQHGRAFNLCPKKETLRMAGVVIQVRPTVWEYTTTTTIVSTITGTPGSLLYIAFPAASTTHGAPDTVVTVRSNIINAVPTTQPILVLTEYNAVIVDPTGSIIETQTLIQSPPPISPIVPTGYDPGTMITLIEPTFGWQGWSQEQKAGVVVAATLLSVSVALLVLLLCRIVKRRKEYALAYERAYHWRRERESRIAATAECGVQLSGER